MEKLQKYVWNGKIYFSEFNLLYFLTLSCKWLQFYQELKSLVNLSTDENIIKNHLLIDCSNYQIKLPVLPNCDLAITYAGI